MTTIYDNNTMQPIAVVHTYTIITRTKIMDSIICVGNRIIHNSTRKTTRITTAVVCINPYSRNTTPTVSPLCYDPIVVIRYGVTAPTICTSAKTLLYPK